MPDAKDAKTGNAKEYGEVVALFLLRHVRPSGQ
ncbi:MAG: hypothetical protein JWP03_5381 [Phycisphaerales bacterium]|nr:hypothetical protein [Phycisphaerales bacterium]